MTSCELTMGKCVPCEGGATALTQAEAADMLTRVDGWEMSADGAAISRRFKFKNFKTALAFVNRLGEIAEKEGHHPDISLGWGYAEILFTTHAIKGLHANDFIMASKTNALEAP